MDDWTMKKGIGGGIKYEHSYPLVHNTIIQTNTLGDENYSRPMFIFVK